MRFAAIGELSGCRRRRIPWSFVFQRVDDFSDLLQHVAYIFGGVFVTVGLACDLSAASYSVSVMAPFGSLTLVGSLSAS